MTELFLTLYAVPAAHDADVRALLADHFDVTLTGNQPIPLGSNARYASYQGDTETVQDTLQTLECTFRLDYDGEYSGAYLYAPSLGLKEIDAAPDGDHVVTLDSVTALLSLHTVDEIHSAVRALTADSWEQEFSRLDNALTAATST